MNRLNKELIDDISYQLGIASPYIEKDWYLVWVLNIIKSLNTDKVKAIFAGGTSLSEAYQLISRFSEDVDFSILGLETAGRKERSKYRDCLIDAIDATGLLSVDKESVISRDENRYTSFYVHYPKEFTLEQSLRHDLKLELRFKPCALLPEAKPITAFASEFIKEPCELTMDCVSVIETAANKLNALMWRVDIKNRADSYNHQTNDPSLIRHLHDLAAMAELVTQHPDFKTLVEQVFEQDKKRGDKTREVELWAFLQATMHRLQSDKEYEREYHQFVSSMSFHASQELNYQQALHQFERICQLFNTQN